MCTAIISYGSIYLWMIILYSYNSSRHDTILANYKYLATWDAIVVIMTSMPCVDCVYLTEKLWHLVMNIIELGLWTWNWWFRWLLLACSASRWKLNKPLSNFLCIHELWYCALCCVCDLVHTDLFIYSLQGYSVYTKTSFDIPNSVNI